MIDINTKHNAHLNIIFVIVQQIALFTHISINGEIFTTQNDIEMQIQFDDLEIELGKKVCLIELFYFKEGKKISQASYIEIYLGNNTAYCFLDIIEGITYEFIFYRNDMKAFVKNEFYIYIKSCDKKIPINLNTMELNDRANLILINCHYSANYLVNDKCEIELGRFTSEIPNFYKTNSYFLFFNNNDFEKTISRELKPINRLNFYDTYNENNSRVEDMYNSIKIIIDADEKNFKINLKNIVMCYKDLIKIMYNNYVFPKSILKKELNKTDYIDFIYKIVVLSYINKELEKNENIPLPALKDLTGKLNKSYTKIKNDKNIEIYEKVLLLINIYLSKLFKYDNELNYLNIKNVDKESPLALSVNFLNKFIEDLDYESQFYYPLLLIDGGLFNLKYKYDFWLRTFGANMNTIGDIKAHLKNLIPNIIIISDKFKGKNIDDYGYVMPQIGIVTLNTKLLGNDIYKKGYNEKEKKHKAFIIFRVLYHELFAHKKSSLNKNWINENKKLSANCFKDQIDGKFKFLPDENTDDIYKDINELKITEINKSTGDSGYFLEYYFGKINNEYIVDILDEYENKIYLGILLDSNLLHKKIKEFQSYIRLQKYMIDNNLNFFIDNNNNIMEQIKQMELIIMKNGKRTEGINSSELKVEYNFFNDNKDNFNFQTTEKNKKKKKLHKNVGSEKKLVPLSSIFRDAFNPFNLEKILELEDKYPRAFFKK